MPAPPPPPPTKLTQAVIDTICAETERGQAMAFAAALADVTDRLAQGRADEAADVPAGFGVGESPHRALLHSYMRARARLAGEMADAIRQNRTGPGERNHTAMAYFERTRFPDVYSDRALEAALVALEPSAAPAASEAPTDPGAVTVELVRCAHCGSDQLPNKKFCGDCGKPMAGT